MRVSISICGSPCILAVFFVLLVAGFGDETWGYVALLAYFISAGFWD